jgi:hypothetical protein
VAKKKMDEFLNLLYTKLGERTEVRVKVQFTFTITFLLIARGIIS